MAYEKKTNRKYTRYSTAVINEILDLMIAGVTPKSICAKYGCSAGYLSELKHKHLEVILRRRPVQKSLFE